jgi:hypothetical protein
MDMLFELIVWIIRSMTKSNGTSANARRNAAMPTQQMNTRRSQPALTASEQKTRDIWAAYRKKQEMLEAQFRAKAPK